MRLSWPCSIATLCLTLWFVAPGVSCFAQSPAAVSATAAVNTTTGQRSDGQPTNANVADWFGKYDQIRRDAEMTMGEKLQSLTMNQATKPSKKSVALAEHMISVYAAAHTAIQALPSLPETKELQDGYIRYFGKAGKTFGDYIGQTQTDAGPSESLLKTKRELEELDKVNKRLDATLRRKYGIPRHKHR